MKRTGNIHFRIFFAVICFCASGAFSSRAQVVSNLGQTPTSKAVVASDEWIAQSFGIAANDPTHFTLNSIQLQMNPGTGSPGGFGVSIYSSTSASLPGTDLGALTGPDPASGGLFTYTPTSKIILSGGGSTANLYFVVVTAATPAAQGGYVWSAADSYTESNPWFIDDVYASSANGSSWTSTIRQDVFQMAIFATPTPEPATWGTMAAGLAVLGLWRRRFSRK